MYALPLVIICVLVLYRLSVSENTDSLKINNTDKQLFKAHAVICSIIYVHNCNYCYQYLAKYVSYFPLTYCIMCKIPWKKIYIKEFTLTNLYDPAEKAPR